MTSFNHWHNRNNFNSTFSANGTHTNYVQQNPHHQLNYNHHQHQQQQAYPPQYHQQQVQQQKQVQQKSNSVQFTSYQRQQYLLKQQQQQHQHHQHQHHQHHHQYQNHQQHNVNKTQQVYSFCSPPSHFQYHDYQQQQTSPLQHQQTNNSMIQSASTFGASPVTSQPKQYQQQQQQQQYQQQQQKQYSNHHSFNNAILTTSETTVSTFGHKSPPKRGLKRGSRDISTEDSTSSPKTLSVKTSPFNATTTNNTTTTSSPPTTSYSPLPKSFINLMKRQRFSKTSGQIRLELDVKECRRRITTGIVEVYHERLDMDTVNVVIRRVFPQSNGSAPWRNVHFIAKAPNEKKCGYPHKPLRIRLKEIPDFPLTKSIELINNDDSCRSNHSSSSSDSSRRKGKNDLTVLFPMIGSEWNPTYSLYDVVIHLTCLVYEGYSSSGGEMELDQGDGMPPPYVADVERFNAIVNSVPHVVQKTSIRNSGSSSSGGGGDVDMGW